MNTEFITRAGKAVNRHKGNLAATGLMALFVSTAASLGEKWIDSRTKAEEASEVREVMQQINKRIDDLQTQQNARDAAQWAAISKKKDK